MDDCGRLILLEDSLQSPEIGDIADLQRAPLHGLAMTAGKVVVGYWRIARFRQRFARVATDKSCTAGDENIQGCSN